MTRLLCLRTSVQSGANTYPIFIGFLPAADILKIAEAPSFSEKTDHSAIARNVLNPPVQDWQRPLNESRIGQIQRFFNDTGEIMPNPVLLSENALGHAAISVKRQQATTGVETNIWEVDVPDAAKGSPKPLWILDGQHRIHGLAGSKQAANEVPLVLLINAGFDNYQAQTFAKLFAQVTTSATQLDPLHDEWLTYAFRLGDYSPENPTSRDHVEAMEAVAQLCEVQTLGTGGITNPFFNGIQFNAFNPPVPRPSGGGFEYSCQSLKDLVLREYYQLIGPRPRLAATDLAIQLGLAYVALQKIVTGDQRETVFFGDIGRGDGQKPMQDAYVVGVLAHLVEHGAPASWTDVLKQLNFSDTDWHFTWVNTTGGSAGNISKKVAWSAFRRVFKDGHLPTGNTNLSDYLQGNGAAITFVGSRVTASGRPSRAERLTISVGPGSVQSLNMQDRVVFKLEAITENVGAITVIDEQDHFNPEISSANLRKGVNVRKARVKSPLKLKVNMQFYGGRADQSTVNVRWEE